MKIFRTLGKKGRITIPLEIRAALNLSCNDILSFAVQDGSVLVVKEKICDHCVGKRSVRELADALTKEERQELLGFLVQEMSSCHTKKGGRV